LKFLWRRACFGGVVTKRSKRAPGRDGSPFIFQKGRYTFCCARFLGVSTNPTCVVRWLIIRLHDTRVELDNVTTLRQELQFRVPCDYICPEASVHTWAPNLFSVPSKAMINRRQEEVVDPVHKHCLLRGWNEGVAESMYDGAVSLSISVRLYSPQVRQ
jgi:hypothetical protein